MSWWELVLEWSQKAWYGKTDNYGTTWPPSPGNSVAKPMGITQGRARGQVHSEKLDAAKTKVILASGEGLGPRAGVSA